MTKPIRKINAIAQAHMIKLLLEHPSTCAEIAEESGLHRVTVSEYVRALRQVKAAHVHAWEQDSMGRDSIMVIKLGPGRDAKRARVTNTERSRLHQARLKERQMHAVTAGTGRFVPANNGRLRFERIVTTVSLTPEEQTP